MKYRHYLSEFKEYRNALKQILAYPFLIIRAAATLCDVIAMSTRKRNNSMIILISISLSRVAATLWAVGWV